MSPKGPVRSNSKHQNPPRLPAAICLSMVLHNAVEHVVPAARRRAGPASEDGGALVSVERERDEDVPEHGLRTKSVGVHLLLICSRGDFEERGVNGVVRREPPGESAFDPLCNALEPVGLELPKLSDGSLVGKPRAVDGAAFVLEPLDGRDHALYGGHEPVGDGECVAQHGGHAYSCKRLLYNCTKEYHFFQGGAGVSSQLFARLFCFCCYLDWFG